MANLRPTFETRGIHIHGRTLAYRCGGEGTPVVLIHGITQDSSTWDPLAERLMDRMQLIAPDLPGHGASDNPPGDHSMGAYASTLRDLMFALGVPRATVVGHSLGGGVTLQFAYQFPEMVDRIVLIDSGGLGRDVSPLLRAAALPGADVVLSLLTSDGARSVAESSARLFTKLGLQLGTDLREVWRGLSGLARPEARRAFLRTVRATIGVQGQAVSARDKLYLASHVPTLILWGARDRIIPLTHATVAHQSIEGSWLRVLEDAGHFPHVDDPDGVAEHIAEFIWSTEPSDVERERWGEILRTGPLDDPVQTTPS